ncbi:MAG TPA: M14 family metallopeptidase, partial [Gemmatimonadales bacterium]|nr:M14 family metallopeptidase [Gemmatimonadales bacterium]
MTRSRRIMRFAGTLLLAGLSLPVLAVAQQIPTPERFFGFQMGADRKLAGWDRMVEYYRTLDRASDRLQVVDLGPSTMGHPFVTLFVSSPGNLARLEELRQVNAKLSDPRGVPEAEVRPLLEQARAVVVQSMGLHSSEVASTQMAVELAYDLVARNDEETARILDNVIAILIPSFNPDGTVMITDWYDRTVGTEYEGVGMPWLYHKYVGHDNNRDAFMTNMVESQYAARILFREWVPQAYIDHHQMGPLGARLYVPPYADPIRPSGDPLVWREMSWYGAHIAYKEEEHGKAGVVNAAIYSGWGHFGFHWITPFHNIAGMLTESASARLASPFFLHPDQLRGGARGLPEYEAQTTFPNPWPGGWWRLRDIVEQQKISAWAVLDLAARNRETVLWNAYLKARRQTERGASGRPAAYVIPAEQHDALTAVTLVNKLLVQGIEIQRAPRELVHDGRVYGVGSFVVSMAQPKMGVIRWLLGRTLYPDNTYTRDRDGAPIRPYDMATDNMAEFMGVRVDPVDTPVTAELSPVTAAVEPRGTVASGASSWRLDGRLNASYRAVNLLLDRGTAVRRDADGNFLVSPAAALAGEVAQRTGVDFTAFQGDAQAGTRPVRRPRVGLYDRYSGGNMDEGWTRFVLEQFGFPYTTVRDSVIRRGRLEARFDVIVLPNDDLNALTGERRPGGTPREEPPPEYRSGLGQEGVDALQAFVKNGGTLVTFGEAGALPIERFGLPLRNVLAGVASTAFWSPGSTLRARFDTDNPLAYGMPDEGLVTFLANNQVYEIVSTARNHEVETIVTFPERDLLQSGWLLGESLIAKKATMVAVRHGRGRVILIGFRPQHRAQTHGT